MSAYDATFRYWAWAFDEMVRAYQNTIFHTQTSDGTIAAIKMAVVEGICATHQSYCLADLVEYDSFDDCLSFLGSTRFGESYEAGRDTILCRSIHQNMVPFRPQVHCPHIGKSGGGMCTDDITYQGTVDSSYFANGTFIPNGFVAANQTTLDPRLINLSGPSVGMMHRLRKRLIGRSVLQEKKTVEG